jgi:C1A family cysteine protease
MAKPMMEIWEAQQQILLHGGFVSKFDIYSDFRDWFRSRASKTGIYKPNKKAQLEYGHAVFVVGYDDENSFWVVKNSWSQKFGDNGFFRVRFKSSVMLPLIKSSLSFCLVHSFARCL